MTMRPRAVVMGSVSSGPPEDASHPGKRPTSSQASAAGRISTAAYTSVQWERLVAVKTTLDPANVFHHNANIPPRSPTT